MVGDPHYMAPEQISGQGYGYGIDYWSLGILIYAMLQVETPFACHTSETKVCIHRLRHNIPHPRRYILAFKKRITGWCAFFHGCVVLCRLCFSVSLDKTFSVVMSALSTRPFCDTQLYFNHEVSLNTLFTATSTAGLCFLRDSGVCT